jgi:hypothetical protein
MRLTLCVWTSVLPRLLLTGGAVLVLSLVSLFIWRLSQTTYMKSHYQAFASSAIHSIGNIFPQTPVTQVRWGASDFLTSFASNFPQGFTPFENAARDAWVLTLWFDSPFGGGTNSVGLPIAPAMYAGITLGVVVLYRRLLQANRHRLMAVARGKDWQPLPPLVPHWVLSLAFAVPVLAMPRMLFGFWFYYDVNVELFRPWSSRMAIVGLHISAMVWFIAGMEISRHILGRLFKIKNAAIAACCSRCGYLSKAEQICPECGYECMQTESSRWRIWMPWFAMAMVSIIFALTPLWTAWVAALSELI